MKKTAIIFVLFLVVNLAGCGKKNVLSDYNIEGMSYMAYSAIELTDKELGDYDH